MNFREYNATTSSDAIQPAEIGFGFRLDERVIPVDLPNSNALITIDVWAEVNHCLIHFFFQSKRAQKTWPTSD